MQSLYKSRFIDVVLIISSLYSIYFIFHKFSGGKIPFWDFHVYYCGAEYYLKGLVPYGDSSLGILKDCLNPNILLTVNSSPLALEILKFLALINFSNLFLTAPTSAISFPSNAPRLVTISIIVNVLQFR